MARMLHNWMRGLVLLALLLGAAWMLRPDLRWCVGASGRYDGGRNLLTNGDLQLAARSMMAMMRPHHETLGG